ncbi:MAG: hypothetical protein RLO80_02420 [Hyphomonas sp.]
MTISIEPILQFGDFTSPLRNIRARLDEYYLELDLIPSRTLPDPIKVDPNETDALKLILGGSREIVEGERYLRLEFQHIWGWMTHEEFSENVGITLPIEEWPQMTKCRGAFPLVKVIGSPWLAQVPDLERENMFHFRIWSMTTYMDIISYDPEGRWLPNV